MQIFYSFYANFLTWCDVVDKKSKYGGSIFPIFYIFAQKRFNLMMFNVFNL